MRFDAYQDQHALDIAAPDAAHAQDVAGIHRRAHLRCPFDANIGDYSLSVKSSRIDVTTGVAGSQGQFVQLRLQLANNAREEARIALPGLALAGVANSNRSRNRM